MNKSLKALLLISMASAISACGDFQDNSTQHHEGSTGTNEPAVDQNQGKANIVQVYDYVNDFTGKGIIATEWLQLETEEARSPAVRIRYIVDWDEENTNPIVAFGIQIQYRTHEATLLDHPLPPKVIELRVLADGQRRQASPGDSSRASNQQHDYRLITTFWFSDEMLQTLLRSDAARMQFLADRMTFTFSIDERIQESLQFISNYVISKRQL